MQISLSNSFLSKVRGKKILLAISGGVDSMVLLDVVSKQRENLGIDVEVVHVNHNLRGKESDADENLVLEVCKAKNIKCNIVSIDVTAQKEKTKETIEEAARNLRYQEIRRIKETGRFDYIVIAHNQDDQAETVLMHICRGCGLDGAVGIGESDDILRPLLEFSKRDIYAYASANNIVYREDKSNSENEYNRNYIRNIVLPSLEKIYPAVKLNLTKFAKFAKDDVQFIQNTINFNIIKQKDGKLLIPVDVASLHPSAFSRVIRKTIQLLGVYKDIEQKHIELVKELFMMKNGNKISLPHNVSAIKEYNYVIFERFYAKKTQKEEINYSFGRIDLDTHMSVLVEEVASDDIVFEKGVHYFDLDGIPSNAVFRNRENGDFFKRIGSGNKTLSDYLTDKKVPRSNRDNLFVLASGKNILLVLGDDISENIKITDGTTRFGKITIL